MEEYRYAKLHTGDKVFLSPDTPQEKIEQIKKYKVFKILPQYSTPKKNKWWQFWRKTEDPMLLGYIVTYIGENYNGIIKLPK